MIHFETIRWRNLLSTGNAWTEVRLDQHPMTLIIGKNGSGKSTLLDALCFVLFNRAFRVINKAQLVNSVNNAECLVEVEFKTNGNTYKVVRGIKPERFEIYQNGAPINQDAAARDYQKHLENTILGFNLKTFTQIVIVGSSTFVPFMLLKSWERRTIIEDLLDIGIFSTMNKVLAARAKALNETTFALKGSIQTVMDKIDLQKRYIAESKRASESTIEIKRNELANNENAVTERREQITDIQATIKSLQDSIDESKVAERIQVLENFRIKIQTNIRRLENDIQFYETHDTCPTCQQSLVNKEHLLNQCAGKLTNQQSGLLGIEHEQAKAQEQHEQVRQVQQQITARQTEITRLLTSVDAIQQSTTRLLAEIEELTTRKPISDDLMAVSQQLFADLARLTDERKQLVEQRGYYDLVDALLQDNGIKAKIIKQYLPVINKMVNRYLASMEFFVDFHLDEEFAETIKSRHRDTFSYHNFSEGEKLRIDLALLFTWRAVAKMKNSINTNLLIMDEILDGSLDAAGMDEFLRLLNAFGNEANVFLISHRGDILADKFANVIQFSKVGLFSEVVA